MSVRAIDGETTLNVNVTSAGATITGTVTAPSLPLESDSTSGIYEDSGKPAVTVAGVKRLHVSDTELYSVGKVRSDSYLDVADTSIYTDSQKCQISGFTDANFNSITLTTTPVAFSTTFSTPTGFWNLFFTDGANYGTIGLGVSKHNGSNYAISIHPQGGVLVNSATAVVFIATTTTAVITVPGFAQTVTLSYNSGTNGITLQATSGSITTFKVRRCCFRFLHTG